MIHDPKFPPRALSDATRTDPAARGEPVPGAVQPHLAAPGTDLFGEAAALPSSTAPAKPLFQLPPLRSCCDLVQSPATARPGEGSPLAPGRAPLNSSPERGGGPPLGGGGAQAAPATFAPVAAMEAVLALRCKQIHEHGHSLEADLAMIAACGKRHAIAAMARTAMTDAIEDMQFNKDPAQIRRRLVKACALGLAAIDAEDARRTHQTPSQGPN